MDQCLLQDEYNIGNNLKRLRIKADLTQQEIVIKLRIMEIPMSKEIPNVTYDEMIAGKSC